MAIYIALLRGINVGGRNRLPMAELRAMFAAAGCADVMTYIQSGNVVFRRETGSAAALADEVGAAIEAKFGFCPTIHLLGVDELHQAITENPFPEAESAPTTLHVSFLDALPDDKAVEVAR